MEEHYISSTLAENFSYSRLDVVSVLDKEDPMVLATSYTMYKIGKLSYFWFIFYLEIYDVNLKFSFKTQQWGRKFLYIFVNWLEWLKCVSHFI